MHKKVKARPRHDQGLPIALHQADMRQNSWVGGEFQQHGSWPLFSGCNLGQMGPNWAMVVFFEISMHEVFIWNFTIFHQIDQKLLRKNDVAIIISHPVQVYGSKAADFAGFMVILVKSNFAALWFYEAPYVSSSRTTPTFVFDVKKVPIRRPIERGQCILLFLTLRRLLKAIHFDQKKFIYWYIFKRLGVCLQIGSCEKS